MTKSSTTSPYSWQEFERFVAEILDLGGFEHKSNVKLQGRQTDVWCTVGNSLLSARVIVECKSTKGERSLPLSYVTEFCSRLSLARTSGMAELGWLVTNHSIPDNAWTIIKDAHLEGACSILHPRELLSKLIDLPRYLSQARLSFPTPVTGYVDPDLQVLTEVRKYYPHTVSFTALLDIWVGDPGRPLLLLLGDYGQGKTTSCEEIVRRYQNNEDLLRGRIPLFIRLRDVANQGYNLPALLRVCLQEHSGLNFYSFELIKYLAKRGMFVFIFDGLDEITYALRWTEVFEGFRQIARIAYPGNKIIVTSRPAAFPPKQSVVASLERLAQLFPESPSSHYARVNYLVAYLKYFDEQKIREAMLNFGVSDPDDLLGTMAGIHDLTDLARRPITLRMILESLEKIQLGEVHGHEDLYSLYTARWFSRDAWRSNIEATAVEFGRDLKQEFVESLAWTMLKEDLTQVDSSFVEEHIVKYCSDLGIVRDLVQAFSREMMVCSFLDYRRDGTLQFSHKSFYEFFIAKHLASLNDDDLLDALSTYLLEREILSFLDQLVDWNSFLYDNDIHKKVERSRTLAANILQSSAVSDLHPFCEVALPSNSRISCHSERQVCIEVIDSELSSLELMSESWVTLKIRSCGISDLEIGSSDGFEFHAFASTVKQFSTGSVEGARIHLEDVSIEGGFLPRCQECEFTFEGKVSLTGLIFDSFEGVSVQSGGQCLEPSEGVKLLRSIGARLRSDSAKKKRKRKRRRRQGLGAGVGRVTR